MPARIPDSHRDLLEGPVVVSLATVLPDGQPHVTPVWCDYDGTFVRVNTARGRQKERDLSVRPKVTILAVDPNNPYRWIEVRGCVEELTKEGAVEHIDQLARLYTDKDSYFGGLVPAEQRDQQTRVMVKIRPQRVVVAG